jgi:hypothetical protein
MRSLQHLSTSSGMIKKTSVPLLIRSYLFPRVHMGNMIEFTSLRALGSPRSTTEALDYGPRP